MEMDNDRNKPEEDESSALKADLVRAKLGLVVHYVLLGFAPVVSVVALIFAVMAFTGNQANRAQFDAVNARIESVSAMQPEPKGELDIFRVSLAHEKALLAEDRKKMAEQDAQIIANVTQLQVKLKVSPTLEEQLSGHAKAPAAASQVTAVPVAAPSVAAPVATPVPAKVEKKPVAQPAAKPAAVAKKSAPVAKVIKKKPVPAPTSAEKAAKAKALKKTIEDFNKNDKK